MKKITLLFTALALSFSVMAQNYYHIEYSADVTKSYIYGDYAAGKVVMTKALNDKYSAKQTLPFTFKFYGQDVTEYLVSDNGYITFNTSATTSTGTAMALPAGGEPNNAIYAFWNDFEMKSAPNASFPVNVYSYTKGTSPNRVHVIQWFGLSNNGKAIAANADVFAFALVLHEQNGMFDVINGSYGSASTKGTMGAENADGSKGYAVSGSPNLAFPVAATTAPADLTAYRFYYGDQADNDAGVVNATLPRIVKTGGTVPVKATVVNFGTKNITSFDLNYTVNGGSVQTKSFTGVNIPSGNSLTVTHGTDWNTSTAGTDYKFDIYVSNVNAVGDDNTANDHFLTNVLVNSGTTTTRTVLAEESTGAWCGYCPDGHVTAKAVNEVYPDVIFLKHHSSDGMTTAESNQITSTFADGYPDLIVDRTVNSSGRSTWTSDVVSRRSVGAPVSLVIENKSFNESTRVITYDVKVTFVDDFAGDLRIGSIIMEDYVRGPENNQWSQVNYYSKDFTGGPQIPTHEMYNQTSPMVGYYHNHVASAMPNGAWGQSGIIPEVAKKGESYTLKVTYTLPAMTTLPAYNSTNITDWCSTLTDGEYKYGKNKPADIHLIGFVASYDDFNARNRPILNAGFEKLWDKAAGISTTTYSQKMNVYPNPANNVINIEVEDLTSEATVRIMDVSGKVVMESAIANGQGSVNVESLTNGVYMLEVTSGTVKSTEKLIISK